MRLVNAKSMVTAAALALAVGCGGSSSGGGTGTSTKGQAAVDIPTQFQIYPPMLFSGYDGGNDTFKLPLQVFKNEGAITLKVDDESLLALDKANGDNTQVTYKTLKAGSTMIHATAGGKTVSATVSVATYTPDQVAVGKKRYTTAADKDNPACMDCHGAGKGPDHTPSEIDADPDEDITNTFLTGKDPEGRPVGMEFQQILKGHTHMWKITKEEETGVVAFLRSLTPTAYPEFDKKTSAEK